MEVENPIGPGLLSLRLAGPGLEIASGPDWQVTLDGGRVAPVGLADDTRRSAAALAVETPAEALRERWVAVALLFVAGAAASLALRGRGSPRLWEALPGASLALALAAWAALFARKLVLLPVTVGFDARNHLAYVDWLATRRELPLATDGWSMFHPPCFTRSARPCFRRERCSASRGGPRRCCSRRSCSRAERSALVATALLARRLLPGDPAARALAVLFAAVLPVNLYTAAYFSNESLHTLLVSLALLASVDVLLAPRPRAWRLVLLGTLFGLAALTKFTVLVRDPDRVRLPRVEALARGPRAAARLAGAAARRGPAGARDRRLVLPAQLARAWRSAGGELAAAGRRPDLVAAAGFHTLAYFTRFGESLVHPYMAGFRSFWDSGYSTFWGDGYVGGRVFPADRHGLWNYDFMSIGYWLALPATLLCWRARCAGSSSRCATPTRAGALRSACCAAAAWGLGLAYLYLTLALAFFAQAKATYLLALLTPLALWFALGFRWLDSALGGRPGLRAALHGWLAAFAGVLYLGFAG